MSMYDEEFYSLNRLYKIADRFVGTQHKMASEKFQMFGKDAMDYIRHLSRRKFTLSRMVMF